MTVVDVAAAVRSFRFRFASEDELQAAIAEGLKLRGFAVEREVRLDERSRIDLLVDGTVGVEVKVAGQAAPVTRQVARYLVSDRVEGLVLVTSSARHYLPPEIAGKPVEVVTLRGVA